MSPFADAGGGVGDDFLGGPDWTSAEFMNSLSVQEDWPAPDTSADLPPSQAVSLTPQSVRSRPQLQTMILKSQTEWLKCNEVVDLLSSARKEGFPISQAPAVRPQGGTLFLYDRVSVKFFRNDGHDWRKKGDGKAVRETHEKLKLDQVVMLNCYYAHAISPANLQRRCYWLLDSNESLVLVHYLSVGQDSSRANLLSEKKSQQHAPDIWVDSGTSGITETPVLWEKKDSSKWTLDEEADSQSNCLIQPAPLQKQDSSNSLGSRSTMQRASSQLADQLAGLPFPDLFPSDDGDLDKEVFPEGFGQEKDTVSVAAFGQISDNLPHSGKSSSSNFEQSMQSPFGHDSQSASLKDTRPLRQTDMNDNPHEPFQGLDDGALQWADNNSSSGVCKSSSVPALSSEDGSSSVFIPPAVDAEPLNPVHFTSSEADLWSMINRIMDPSADVTPAMDTRAPDFPPVADCTSSSSYSLRIEEACPSRLLEAGGQKILVAVTGLDNFDFSSRYISVNIGGVLIDPQCIQNGVVSFTSPELKCGTVRLTLLDTFQEEWVQLCDPITLTVESRQHRVAKVPVAINGQLDRHGQVVLIKQLLQKRSAADIMAMAR